MPYNFLERLTTPGVKAAQMANGVGSLWENLAGDNPSATFTDREAAFIAERDSFYLASISQNGWPYVQHRGGPPGFLRVLDPATLAFPDYRGNRQYITLGNIADNSRVALFLMDYPRRRRLKILAYMTPHDLAAEPELAARLVTPGYRGRPERVFKLKLAAFDWNCPQHITQRFTAEEVAAATLPLRQRLAALEAENAQLRQASNIAVTPSQEELIGLQAQGNTALP